MRRFAFAAGLLATFAVAQADAGYFIVRIVVDGGGAAEGGTPGGPPMGGPGPMGGGLQPPRGGPGPMGGGGPPPMGGGGPPPMGSGGPPPMGGGGPGAAPTGVGDPTRSIFVVVPVTKSPAGMGRTFYPKLEFHPTFNPRWGSILDHPFGTTNLFVDNVQVQLYTEFAQTPDRTKTRTSVVKARYDLWKTGPKDDGQKLLDLVGDALEVGMVPEAVQMADELLAGVAAKKVKTTPQVDRFAAAYGPIQKGLAGRTADPGDGPGWKAKLQRGYPDATELPDLHYYLVTWGGGGGDEGRRRLAQLEQNFQAFYLSHAARGVALPLPDKQLPVILASTGEEFRKLAGVLNAGHPVVDGVYAPDYDVLVLSPEPVDAEVGKTFQRQANAFYRAGVSREMLLHPERYTVKSPNGYRLNADNNPNVKGGTSAEEAARAMTWAMADAFYQRDSELAAVSREGSRQLLFASGLAPRFVAQPAWLANGAAAYYHRPRGAVFTYPDDDKAVATVGLSTGYGVPNFAQQKLFRELAEKKELNKDTGLLLRQVVTDAYFAAAAAKAPADLDDAKLPKRKLGKGGPAAGGPAGPSGPATGAIGGEGGRPQGPGGPPPMGGGPMGPALAPPAGAVPAEDELTYERRRKAYVTDKAAATAWSLYYYLATKQPAGLRRYYAELDKLPRDLPLDRDLRLALFLTAFDLTAAPAATDGKKTLRQFADEWLRAMAELPMAGSDVPLVAPAPVAPETGTPTGPPGIGGPRG